MSAVTHGEETHREPPGGAWWLSPEGGGGLFTAAALRGPTRGALAARLQAAVNQEAWAQAATSLTAVLDTWPLSHLVEHAWASWRAAPGDPLDLDVLARAAFLMGMCRGWPIDGGWPQPEPQLLAGGSPSDISPSGSPQLLADLDEDKVIERRDDVARRLVRGALKAVAWSGPPPQSAAAQLALGELRMEGSHQAAFDLYGAVGLQLQGAPRAWTERLLPPSPGAAGPSPKPVITWAILPGTTGTLAAGELKPVCMLFLPGPRQPVATQPEIATLLASMEGTCAPPPMDPDKREAIAAELLALGALSA